MPGNDMTNACAKSLRSAEIPATRKRFSASWFSIKVIDFSREFFPSSPGFGLKSGRPASLSPDRVFIAFSMPAA